MKLRVSHIPQVPMKPFFVPVNDIKEAKKGYGYFGSL